MKQKKPQPTLPLQVSNIFLRTIPGDEPEPPEPTNYDNLTDIFDGELRIVTFTDKGTKIYKDYTLSVRAIRDDKNVVNSINFVIKSHEDIFFCMKAEFGIEFFNEELEMKDLVVNYSDIPLCLFEIFKSIKENKNEYFLVFHNDTYSGLLKIVQNIEILHVDLLDIKMESLSEDELDQMGQNTYSELLKEFSITKRRYDAFISELLVKNPDVLQDIIFNGQDFVHTPEEKSLMLGKILEENEKMTSAFVKHDLVNENVTGRKLPYKCLYLDKYEKDQNGNIVYVDDRGQNIYTSTEKFNYNDKLTPKLT